MSRMVEAKVATPPEALTEAPEAMAPGPLSVRLIVSLLPVFEPVSTLP